MAAYDPLPLRIAKLEPDEKHLHTFLIYPVENRTEGGFFLKVTGYRPDGTEFFAHLTDRRILIEPRPQSRFAKLALGGLILSVIVFVPGAQGAGHAAAKSMDKATAIMNEQGETTYSFPYSHIKSVEIFKQWLSSFVRLLMKVEPSDGLIFNVGDPHNRLSLFGHSNEFVRIVNEIMSR